MLEQTCPLRPRRVIALAVVLLATSLAVAEAQQIRVDPSDPARDALRRQQQLDEAGRESRRSGIEQPRRPVSYEDVLASPDDIEVNFGWAQTQLTAGDVRGAAATLERILLVAPNAPRLRLLYAVVLIRLDNAAEAERQLALVETVAVEPALRSEIARYRKDLEYSQRPTRFTATVSLGMQYDWNRNQAPRSGEVLLGDSRLVIGNADRRKSDWQAQGIAKIEMTHDLGGQDPHRLTAAASYVRGEQARVDAYDFQIGSVEFGGVYDMAPNAIVPNVYARTIRLANQSYGHAQGVNLRFEHRANGRLQIYGFGTAEHQTFYAISRNQRAPERTGPQYTVGMGLAWVATPAHRFGIEAGQVFKSARKSFESYSGPQAQLSHIWLLGQGAFLATSIGGELADYDRPETLVSARERRDRIGRARTTLGLPVNLFIPDETIGQMEPFRDLTFFVSLEGVRNRSNITSNQYDNYRVAIGLTKRWDF